MAWWHNSEHIMSESGHLRAHKNHGAKFFSGRLNYYEAQKFFDNLFMARNEFSLIK